MRLQTRHGKYHVIKTKKKQVTSLGWLYFGVVLTPTAESHSALYAHGCYSWNKRVFIAYVNSVFLSFSQLSLSQLAVASHSPTLSHSAGSPWQQQLPAPLALSPMASAHQLPRVVRFPPTHSCNNTQNIHKEYKVCT